MDIPDEVLVVDDVNMDPADAGSFAANDTNVDWASNTSQDLQFIPPPPTVPTPQPAPIIPPRYKKEQHSGFRADVQARQRTRTGFWDAVFAMAIFRCWHIVLFYAIYTTIVTYFYMNGAKWLNFPNALLKIAGTCLGFIVSYRSQQSFQRWTEGRKIWASIISTTRVLSRTIWFNVPNTMPQYDGMPPQEQHARALMEKKTIINLIEAFAVSTKHYLRQEDGIYYTDLYHLVKFLPAYSLPAGLMSEQEASQHGMQYEDPAIAKAKLAELEQEQGLPLPVNARGQRAPAPMSLTADANSHSYGGYGGAQAQPPSYNTYGAPVSPLYSARPPSANPRTPSFAALSHHEKLAQEDEVYLIPAYKPPRFAILQVWPFSYLAGIRLVPASKATGERARKIRAKIQNKANTHNLPLEITLYLGSYLAAHQRRGTNPVVINNLATNINALVTHLTGLERILTTPIPFSYRMHLWVILCGYCLLLPLQILKDMKWFTIPGVVLFCCVFFGFLTAGEEIENPFGYCKNDLNLDHFTHNIIRNELIAITSAPPPDPAVWAFSPENNLIFTGHHHGGDLQGVQKAERVTPDEWIRRGSGRMMASLRLS